MPFFAYRRHVIALLYLVLSFCISAVAFAGGTPDDSAPEFNLPSLDAQMVRVDWSGKMTMLTFGALWCPNCREELPDLAAFAAAHQPRLTFYFIDIREPGDRVMRYMSENDLKMPVLLDKNGKLSGVYMIERIPTTLLVNTKGKVVFRKTGVMSRFALEKEIVGRL